MPFRATLQTRRKECGTRNGHAVHVNDIECRDGRRQERRTKAEVTPDSEKANHEREQVEQQIESEDRLETLADARTDLRHHVGKRIGRGMECEPMMRAPRQITFMSSCSTP